MVVKPQSRGARKQGIVNDGEKRLQFGLQLCPRCNFGGSGVQKATKVFEIAVVKVLNSATSNGQTRIKTVVAGNTWATNWVWLAHRCRETFVGACLHCPRPRGITDWCWSGLVFSNVSTTVVDLCRGQLLSRFQKRPFHWRRRWSSKRLKRIKTSLCHP